MSGSKGSRYERQLIRALEDMGFAVIRAAASGARTTSERPDLLCARDRGDESYAMEVKMTSRTTAYADADEVRQLEWFAESFNVTPAVAARFKGDALFYIVPTRNCRVTPAGNYGVPKADADERAAFTLRENPRP